MGFRRVNGKLVKDEKKPEVVVKNGHRMAVLRPMTPEAAAEAVRRARQLAGSADRGGVAFQKIIEDQEKMTFMGLLGKDGRVLDPTTLDDLGPLVPGDSFVSYEDMLKAPPEAMEPPS